MSSRVTEGLPRRSYSAFTARVPVKYKTDHSSMEAWPLDRMKRSRLGQIGSFGSKRMTRFHSVYTSGANAMGVPGWPEFAFWTASMESVRIVLIASWSSSLLVMPSGLRCFSPLSCQPRSPALSRLGSGVLLQVPAELVAHGREQLVGEVGLAARTEPLI